MPECPRLFHIQQGGGPATISCAEALDIPALPGRVEHPPPSMRPMSHLGHVWTAPWRRQGSAVTGRHRFIIGDDLKGTARLVAHLDQARSPRRIPTNHVASTVVGVAIVAIAIVGIAVAAIGVRCGGETKS